MAVGTQWQLSGDYFENCNCSVVCPCLISPNAAADLAPDRRGLRRGTRVSIDSGGTARSRSTGSIWL